MRKSVTIISIALFGVIIAIVWFRYGGFSHFIQTEKEHLTLHGVPLEDVYAQMQVDVFSRPDSVKLIAKAVIELANEKENPDWQAKMLNLTGVIHAMESDYYTARRYFHKALELAIQSGDPKNIGDAYNNLGGVDLLTGNHRFALENFHEAIRNYELAGLYDKIADIHSNIGSLFIKLDNIEKSLYHLRKAYLNFLNLDNAFGQCIALNSLASAFLKNNQTDSAKAYVEKSIALSQKTANYYALAQSYEIEADIFRSKGKTSDAIVYYRKSLEVWGIINNTRGISHAYLGLAQTYLSISDTEQALVYSTKALDLSGKLQDLDLRRSIYEVNSVVYQTTGDFETSLYHRKKADELNIEISDQSKLHQIYNIEISQLIKDKEIQKLEIDRQKLLVSKRNSLIIIITLLFTILMVVLFLIFTKNRQQQKIRLKETLFRHAEERSKAALNAEVNERKRLGIELHDGVGPLLSLAKLNVTSLIENEDLHEKRKSAILHSTVDTLDEVLKEMKHISHNMAPIVLIEKGFEVAVRDLVSKLNETEKYRVTLEIAGLNGSIGPYYEHALYRSILEIVHNTLLHAHGSEINIQIIQNDEDITIMIEDNGKGFDGNQKLKGNGLGLKSTLSRVEGISGKLYIDSKPGRGTIVSIIVPIEQKI